MDTYQDVDVDFYLENRCLFFLRILKTKFPDVKGLENPYHLSDLSYYLPSDKRTKNFIRLLKHKDEWVCVVSGFKYLKWNFYKYKHKIIVFGTKNLSKDLKLEKKLDRLLPKEKKYKLYFYELKEDEFDRSNFYISLIICQILCEGFYIEDINGVNFFDRKKLISDFDECVNKKKIFEIEKKYVGRFDEKDNDILINGFKFYFGIWLSASLFIVQYLKMVN